MHMEHMPLRANFLRLYILIVNTEDLTWMQCKLFNNMAS